MKLRPRLVAKTTLLAVFGLLIANCGGTNIDRLRQGELTQTYGEEAQAIVQSFESTWLGYDVRLNPDLQYEIATERWVDYMGIPAAYAGLGGYVTTSATVEDVAVVEYSATRLKVWACVTIAFDEFRKGEVQRSGELDHCGTYVFWKVQGAWKLAGYFNDTDRRYWNEAPEWLREVICELP